MKIIGQLVLFIKFYLYMHFNSERFPCTFILFLLFMPSRSREIQTCVGLKKNPKNWHMSQAHHLRDDTLISAGESHSLILHYLVNNKRLLLIKISYKHCAFKIVNI